MFINPAIEEGSRSVKVVATVPNGDNRLKGGLFVRGRIVTATRRQVLQVPREALLDWDIAGRRAALFTIVDTHAERRAVTTGAVTDQMVEITSGLASGDRVVTRGAFAVRPGDAVVLADEGP
jgi:RND family efflux transporter MFP subunit